MAPSVLTSSFCHLAMRECTVDHGPQRESRIREKVESRVFKFTALRSVGQKAKADPAWRWLPLTL
jgi:hypothetical protein